MIRRVLVAGGGTGGHLFPGLAVVEELRRRDANVEVCFVGTERGIEARVLPDRGERLELIQVTPLKGRSPTEFLKSALRLPGAGGSALSLLKRFKPDLVIGVGGYASGPVLAAASLLRVPTAVLEQNARVGLTNRLLSPFVGRAYVSFSNTQAQFPAAKVRSLGNPIRRELVDAARIATTDPDGFEARADTLLVLGGSQGARVLNKTVPEALSLLPKGQRPPVLHQTGSKMVDEVRARYAELGVEAEVVPFIDQMARAYQKARIVIARAGATTVAELCAIGRAAILVPYPFAADDHQSKNAEALMKQGAAISIQESELTKEALSEALSKLLSNNAERLSLAKNARELGQPEAAAHIVDDLYGWLGSPHRAPEGPGEGEADSADSHDSSGTSFRRSTPRIAAQADVVYQRRTEAPLGLRGSPGFAPRIGARRRRSVLPGANRAALGYADLSFGIGFGPDARAVEGDFGDSLTAGFRSAQ